MTEAPNRLTAAEAARRIARGELTSEALVAACLERIRAREPEVQAWAFLDPQLALEQARRLDREAPRSLLHGVPFGIKDVIDTADMPTECDSPIYRGHRPRADAACVSLLRRAGCVILGKTTTAEFANNHPTKTRNPHAPGHTPGGSSSGSAAAVADGMVPIALGTQTGGSIIRPAAYCGVVGMKPTFGTINRAGIKFVAESLDTLGLIAASAEDAAWGLHLLSGRELAPAVSGAAPRVGICRTPRWREAEPAAQAAIERAATALARAGARVVEFELPEGCEALFEDHGRIMGYETARALAWEHMQRPQLLSDSLRARIEAGWKLPRKAYDAALQLARESRLSYAERMRECDFLLTPPATGEAPATLATTGSSIFNRLWTTLGVPCVTLPVTRGPHGLPLGVQLAGRAGDDMRLLAWAQWVEGVLAR